MNRMSKYFRSVKDLMKANMSCYHCPDCVLYTFTPTVKMKTVYDPRYKKYSYYMKCSQCRYVTPAFDDPTKTLDVYDDNWVPTETFILSNIF